MVGDAREQNVNYQILGPRRLLLHFERDRVNERDAHIEQSAIVTNLEQEFLSFTICIVRCIVTTRGSSHVVHILQVC